MAETTNISWTDSTWNPIKGLGRNRWMCRKISPGCDHCYASTLNRRFGGEPYPQSGRRAGVDYSPGDFLRSEEPRDWRLDLPALLKPLSWRKPRMIFVCSMTDVAGEWVPDAWLDAIFAVMATANQHTYQVLTKRPSRLKQWFDRDVAWREAIPTWPGLPDPIVDWIDVHKRNALVDWPLPNVWVGVSVEQDRYCWRAETLKQIPARVRFVSAEPLLGPLPGLALEPTADRPGIDWLIVGGESGGGADRRMIGPDGDPLPSALAVVRDLRDRATASGTVYHFKQWGGARHDSGGRLLDGREHLDIPSGSAR